ncbi:ribosome small subunit-dependent GTPase A [Gordoniibacillus kamchatkensis]|uniref:ribosome small subunit-dependent GTPase A n=1 Tax=Gordoniibacillus kamchatkensis TaxID=1590651 RepID=UPI000ACA298F
MILRQWGWNPEWNERFEPWRRQGCTPGRVALEHKHLYTVYTEHGELLAEVAGKLRYEAAGRAEYPAVGDWVALSVRPEEGRATIRGILPRFSKFSRKVAGSVTEEQIVATNMNTVFIVTSLNQDFNVRRVERYLVLAWESGANPVVLLSKADLSDRIEEAVSAVESVAVGVPIHVISSLENKGLDALAPYVGEGQTVALLGSSGVGKSTLINRLAGADVQATGDIRLDDGRGKHTTTHRELIALPGGGLLIDTPGMRELQLWDADDGLGASFQDVEQFAAQCRFPDCRHDREPGCAVRTALSDGSLDRARYQSYVKLQKELAYFARKEDKALQAAEKNKWKKIHQANKKRHIRT